MISLRQNSFKESSWHIQMVNIPVWKALGRDCYWNSEEDVYAGQYLEVTTVLYKYCRANQEWQWRNTLFTIAE